MQSIVKFICLLQVGAICLQYLPDDYWLAKHSLLLELTKLQYSCICCYWLAVLCGANARHSYLGYWINQGTFKWQGGGSCKPELDCFSCSLVSSHGMILNCNFIFCSDIRTTVERAKIMCWHYCYLQCWIRIKTLSDTSTDMRDGLHSVFPISTTPNNVALSSPSWWEVLYLGWNHKRFLSGWQVHARIDCECLRSLLGNPGGTTYDRSATPWTVWRSLYSEFAFAVLICWFRWNISAQLPSCTGHQHASVEGHVKSN